MLLLCSRSGSRTCRFTSSTSRARKCPLFDTLWTSFANPDVIVSSTQNSVSSRARSSSVSSSTRRRRRSSSSTTSSWRPTSRTASSCSRASPPYPLKRRRKCPVYRVAEHPLTSELFQSAILAYGYEQVPRITRDHVPSRPDELPPAREQEEQCQGPGAEGYVLFPFLVKAQ